MISRPLLTVSTCTIRKIRIDNRSIMRRRRGNFTKSVSGPDRTAFSEVQGHLEKLGKGLFGRWQKHFFKLNNHHLVYYKSQKSFSNEDMPLNNYDLKFMEKVDGAVGRVFVLKINANSDGEQEEKSFRAATPSIAGEWVTEINKRIEYYRDMLIRGGDDRKKSLRGEVLADLEDVVVSTKSDDENEEASRKTPIDSRTKDIYHSGWLHKLGRDGLQWKRRWMVLKKHNDDTSMLYWYKHEGLLDAPLGSITLRTVKCRMNLLDNTKRRKWRFDVSTPERELRLRASSLQDQRDWIDRIKPLITKKRASHHCDEILESTILRNGNMLKSGSTWSEHWKTRYFVLSDGKLTWYVEASDYPTHPRNQIVIDKETEIHVVNLQKFKFKLCRGNKELLLSTLNEMDMHDWIKALKNVISGEFHEKLMKDEKHRELREKKREQDEKIAKEMADAQHLARIESVRKAKIDLENAHKRLDVAVEDEKTKLSRVLETVHIGQDMMNSPLQNQKELYVRKLKDGKITKDEYDELISKLPKEMETMRRYDSDIKKDAGSLLDSHKRKEEEEEVSFRKKPNMDDPDLKDARHDSRELTPFPVIEGYLYKKTHRGQRWIKRFFVFRNEFLLWFNSEKEAHPDTQDDVRAPNGILPILEIVRVVKDDLDLQFLMKKGGQMQVRCSTFQMAYYWYSNMLRRMAWFQDSSVQNGHRVCKQSLLDALDCHEEASFCLELSRARAETARCALMRAQAELDKDESRIEKAGVELRAALSNLQRVELQKTNNDRARGLFGAERVSLSSSQRYDNDGKEDDDEDVKISNNITPESTTTTASSSSSDTVDVWETLKASTISKLVLLQNRPNQREELQVFRDLDSGPKVPRGEPWCLIDSHWITKWKRYVRRETDKMPGPITNAVLLNEDGKPRGGLRYYEDYICVNRAVYLSFYFLYRGGPHIFRWTCDIYRVNFENDRNELLKSLKMFPARNDDDNVSISDLTKMKKTSDLFLPKTTKNGGNDNKENKSHVWDVVMVCPLPKSSFLRTLHSHKKGLKDYLEILIGIQESDHESRGIRSLDLSAQMATGKSNAAFKSEECFVPIPTKKTSKITSKNTKDDGEEEEKFRLDPMGYPFAAESLVSFDPPLVFVKKELERWVEVQRKIDRKLIDNIKKEQLESLGGDVEMARSRINKIEENFNIKIKQDVDLLYSRPEPPEKYNSWETYMRHRLIDTYSVFTYEHYKQDLRNILLAYTQRGEDWRATIDIDSSYSSDGNTEIHRQASSDRYDVEENRWMYKNAKGREFGPWSSKQMSKWLQNGAFKKEEKTLLVRRLDQIDYVLLSELVRRHPESPFRDHISNTSLTNSTISNAKKSSDEKQVYLSESDRREIALEKQRELKEKRRAKEYGRLLLAKKTQLLTEEYEKLNPSNDSSEMSDRDFQIALIKSIIRRLEAVAGLKTGAWLVEIENKDGIRGHQEVIIIACRADDSVLKYEAQKIGYLVQLINQPTFGTSSAEANREAVRLLHRVANFDPRRHRRPQLDSILWMENFHPRLLHTLDRWGHSMDWSYSARRESERGIGFCSRIWSYIMASCCLNLRHAVALAIQEDADEDSIEGLRKFFYRDTIIETLDLSWQSQYYAPYMPFVKGKTFEPLYRTYPRHYLDSYLNPQNRGFFRQVDRQRITMKLIGEHLNMSILKEKNIVDRFFSLHDKACLDHLHKSWVYGIYDTPPFELIRNYMGEKIALYFIFLDQIIKLMGPVALLGIVVFFLRLVDEDVYLYSIIAYSMLLSVSFTIFCQLWRRTEQRFALSWASLRSTHNNNNNNKTKIGTQHIETSKTDLRENFQGSLQPSPVTDDLELTYTQNSSSRFLGCMSRRSATNIVWFIIYGFSIAAVVGVYMVLHNDGNVGITESIRLYAMYQFYLSVAMKLTDWENHRTKTGHERSLVLKVFSFAFVNSYISLLYIAFFDCNNPNATYEKESGGMDIIVLNENSTSISPCIRNLSEKTFSLLTFTNLVVNPFVEIGVPYILYKFDSSFKNFCCHCCRCLCCKRSRSDARTCNVIKESELQEYADTDLLVDYMDIINQLGFVALFSFAQPLTPILVLVYVFMESRVDALKLCTQMRRPYAYEAKDIGSWLFWIEALGYLSILTNSWIVLSATTIGSSDTALPKCLRRNFFCVDNTSSIGGYITIDGRNIYFNGPKLMLFLLVVVVTLLLKILAKKMIQLNPDASILDKRFGRITRSILAGAESSIETNERPYRPEGSFDYSLSAEYLKIKGLDHSDKNSQHRHFSKTPSHRLTRDHLDISIDESNAHSPSFSSKEVDSFHIDGDGVSLQSLPM